MRTFARKPSPARHEPAPRNGRAGPPVHDFSRAPVKLQAKLTIDTPGEEKDGLVQRRAEALVNGESPAPPIVHQALESSGQPLDTTARAYFSPRFGRDFSQVRVHADEAAGESANAVHANAYTVGRDVVFAPGQYAPATASGRRLIAHELAHVLQQRGSGAVLQRDDKKKAPAPAKPTAADAPKLELSEHADPCACVIQIHNNETKAHKIAELMHQHCKYSLTLLKSGTTDRRIKLPGHKGDVDPNELFPPDVAEQCMDDSKPCEDFVNDPAKAAATDEKGIADFVHRQFFLTIKKCSKDFSLPVVSLHTNVVSDTEAYRKDPKRIKEFDKTGLTDIDTKAADDPVAKLRKWVGGFGGDVKKQTLDTEGMTNIFRWCDPAEGISKCHIGDPEHPDNIVWVTNAEDLRKLSATKVNAVLQTEVPTPKPGKKSEAQTDLSTMFVVMDKSIRAKLEKLRQQVVQDVDVDLKEFDVLADELKKVESSDLMKRLDVMEKQIKELREALDKLKKFADAQGVTRARLDALRFINVEGPATGDVVKNFQALRAVLQALGLDCCGDTGAASVETGLKPPAPAKKK